MTTKPINDCNENQQMIACFDFNVKINTVFVIVDFLSPYFILIEIAEAQHNDRIFNTNASRIRATDKKLSAHLSNAFGYNLRWVYYGDLFKHSKSNERKNVLLKQNRFFH